MNFKPRRHQGMLFQECFSQNKIIFNLAPRSSEGDHTCKKGTEFTLATLVSDKIPSPPHKSFNSKSQTLGLKVRSFCTSALKPDGQFPTPREAQSSRRGKGHGLTTSESLSDCENTIWLVFHKLSHFHLPFCLETKASTVLGLPGFLFQRSAGPAD